MCASHSKKAAARAASIIKTMMKSNANTEMFNMRSFSRSKKSKTQI